MVQIDLREASRSCLLSLIYEVAALRAAGGRVMKLLHGEKLSVPVRRQLRRMRREGRIAYLIPGEKFSKEDSITQYMLDKCPECEDDYDLEQKNADITVVGI